MTRRPGPRRGSRLGSGRWSSPWLIASSVVVAAVPLLAGWVLFSANPRARAQDPLGQAPGSPGPRPLGRPAGVCPALPDSGHTTLSAPPGDITWDVAAGALAPASPSAGPAREDAGVASCFAHDPEGALLACVRLQLEIAEATATTWPAAAGALAPGPVSDAIRSEVARVLSQADPASGAGTPPAAIAGFDLLSYSPAQAVVDLVFRTQAGALYAAGVSLGWTAGDWHLIPVGPNTLTSPQTAVANLLGYVAWEQP